MGEIHSDGKQPSYVKWCASLKISAGFCYRNGKILENKIVTNKK